MIDRKRAKERTDQRIAALALTRKESEPVRAQLRDYLGRTGMNNDDFARRINYSGIAVRKFLEDSYQNLSADDSRIRKAVQEFMAAHPIEPPQRIAGELYDTANVRSIRETFQKLLPKPIAYAIYGPPGSQKSFCLENEIARLNQEEISKNGHGRRAYYVYAQNKIRQRDLIRDVCVACGAVANSNTSRMISNLAFEFRGRRVLLVIDEAQHLDFDCLEILRQLMDRPPFFSLLFAGSHDLTKKLDRLSGELEQVNSRIIDKVKLPGLLEKEAQGIVWREIGELLREMPAAKANGLVDALVKQATVKDRFENNSHYINVRSLTNALDQIKATRESA